VAEKRIPNLLLYVVFQQVSDLMGEKSLAMLLRQSGLSNYLDNPPPADESPSITVQKYSALLAQIYEIFGPRGSRAIFTQGGRKGGQELRRLHPPPEVDPILWTTKRPKEMKLAGRRVAHARPKEREEGKETVLPLPPCWANE